MKCLVFREQRKLANPPVGGKTPSPSEPTLLAEHLGVPFGLQGQRGQGSALDAGGRAVGAAAVAGDASAASRVPCGAGRDLPVGQFGARMTGGPRAGRTVGGRGVGRGSPSAAWGVDLEAAVRGLQGPDRIERAFRNFKTHASRAGSDALSRTMIPAATAHAPVPVAYTSSFALCRCHATTSDHPAFGTRIQPWTFQLRLDIRSSPCALTSINPRAIILATIRSVSTTGDHMDAGWLWLSGGLPRTLSESPRRSAFHQPSPRPQGNR